MRRALKLLAWLVGGLLLLLVVAAVAVTLFFDPNQYRGQIAALVEKQTGRELEIAGDMDLSLFPWIGVGINRVTLGNARGFGPSPFAEIDEAQVRVALLPLLRRQVRVDTVVLEGLRLNLARNAEGVSNWDDLIAAPAAETPPPAAEPAPPQTEGGPAIAALAVNGLRVRDARVSWQDGVTGTKATVSDLRLTTGALELGEPVPVELAFGIDAEEPALKGKVSLSARVLADLAQQRYEVRALELSTDLRSPLLPTGRLEGELVAAASADLEADEARLQLERLAALGVRLTGEVAVSELQGTRRITGALQAAVSDPAPLVALLGDPGIPPDALEDAEITTRFDADLGEETARLSDLEAKLLGMELRADATATSVLSEPLAEGRLEVAPFVPRDVMAALGIALPEGIEASALTKAALATRFTAGLEQAGVSNLKLQVDDSTLTGKASVRRFEAPVIRYALHLDQIDADRYLPAPEKEQAAPAASPAAAGAAAATQLPLELLRRLDIEGTVDVGRLKVANLRSSKVHATVKAKNGLFRAKPTRAQLYQGSYRGGLTFDVRKETPLLGIEERLTGVQAGPLLKDMLGQDYVTGTASVSAKVTARGLDPAQITKTLNGTGAFEFQDGAVKGFNIAALIRKASAALQGRSAPKEEAQETDFAVLKGTVAIKDGLVRNRDLSAKTPLLRIQGEGEANLVTERVDYLVNAAVVSTLKGQGGQELDELRNITIPVRIKGPFTDPKFDVEIGKALEARAQAELDKEKQKLEQQLKQREAEEKRKLEQRLEQEKKKLEEQLKDGLKNLLKF